MYTRGEELELRWSVRNTAGTLTAPTGLTFTVRSPDGVDTEYVAGPAAEITDNADGTGTLVLVLDQSARWFFRCVTDTPTTAAETDVIVQRSALEDAVIPVPGDPGAAYDGAIARAASGVYSPYLGTASEDGQTLYWNGAIWIKARNAIRPDIDYTGATDATATILAALQTREGCWVDPAPGIVRMNSGLTVPTGRALTGSPRGNRIGHREFSAQTHTGTTIYAYGTGDLFTMAAAGNVTVENLEIWYPNQEINATPDVYGWTFNVPANAHFCTFHNLSVLNPYKLLFADDANGLTIDNIVSYPLNTGISLGRVADVARISNVHFVPTVLAFEVGATLTAYVQANATAFALDGVEEFAFTNCFAYGYNYGILLADADADGFRGTYGSWKGGGLDLMNVGVRVTAPTGLCALGLRISDCGIVPNASGRAFQFSDTAAPSITRDRPRVMASNISVHNAHDRTIIMDTGSYSTMTVTGGHFEGFTNPACLPFDANSTIQLLGVSRPTPGVAITESASGTFADTDPIEL
jgi:hypothetical protein